MSRTIKISAYVLLSIILLFSSFILTIRTPWAQQKITNYVTQYVSSKTGSVLNIDKLFITFGGNIQVEGLYAEDQKKDSLLYLGELNSGIKFMPLLKGDIQISHIELANLKASIHNQTQDSSFNYQFIVDAFASNDSTPQEESTKNTPLSIGSIRLSEIQIGYFDLINGMEANAWLGNLTLKSRLIDFEQFAFEIESFDLKKSEINYKQHLNLSTEQDIVSTENTTDSLLPKIKLDQLKLHDIKLNYQSDLDSLSSKNHIDSFTLNALILDLNSNSLSTEKIHLANSSLSLLSHQLGEQESSSTPNDATSFEWPDWTIAIESIHLVDNQINYRVGNSTSHITGFDPNQIAIRQLNLQLDAINYLQENISFNLKNFAFKEQSDFELQDLNFGFSMTDKELKVSQLLFHTPNNRWLADLKINYNSLNDFFANALHNGYFSLQFDTDQFSLEDAYFFQDSLRHDSTLNLIEKSKPILNTRISGNADKLHIHNLQLDMAENSRVQAVAEIENILDEKTMRFSLPNFKLRTNANDLITFGLDSLSENLPEQYELRGQASGNLTSIATKLDIRLDQYQPIFLDAAYKQKAGVSYYDAQLQAEKLPLATWLQDSSFSAVDLSVQFSGEGIALDDLQAQLDVNLSNLSIDQYHYQPIKLQASINNKVVDFAWNYQDAHLDFDLLSHVNLKDSTKQLLSIDLNLKKANLRELGILADANQASFKLNASAERTEQYTQMAALISQAQVLNENINYPIDDMQIDAFLGNDSTYFKWDSKPIQAYLASNSSLENSSQSVQQYIYSYLNPSITIDTLMDNSINLKIDIIDSPLITSILLPDLASFDPIHINLVFDESRQQLTSQASVPFVNYDGILLDSLHFSLLAQPNDLSINLFFNQFNAGAVELNQSLIEASYNNEKIHLGINLKDEMADEFFNLQSLIWQRNDSSFLQLLSEDFIFNNESWSLNKDHLISWSSQHLSIENFKLYRQKEYLTLQTPSTKRNDLSLLLNFNDFELSNLLSIINSEENLAEGEINGKFNFLLKESKTAFLAELGIDQMKIKGSHVGALKVEAKNIQEDLYDFSMQMVGPASFQLNGDYLASEKEPMINLDLILNRLDLSLLAPFSQGILKESTGYLSGNLQIKGPALNPSHNGNLKFNDASFLVAATNSRFIVPNENISITNDLVQFKQFTIQDENESKLVINGRLMTNNLLNPSLDLQVNTSNFQLLNSKAGDNELFYGKALVDANIQVKGTTNRPDVDAQLKLKKGSDLTYIIPESQVDLVSREGTLEFVSFSALDNNQANLTDSLTAQVGISGIKLKSIIQVDRETNLKVIVDQRSGDYLRVKGEADLSLDMARNGNLSLFGTYEVKEGAYELSMYELVKRKFTIGAGSNIKWSGDPYNARMDLTALYKLETSPADLMADQISGADRSVQNKYRNQLPFIVQMNIKGELLQPVLSFALDMPEDRKGALDGSVYGKIQQLNRNENELNKQVFALLVLNRFFPSSSSTGTGPSTSQMARSSASQLLTSQLNALSDRFVKGVELDLGVDSFTDYQNGSGEDRTQLNLNVSKKLFNDRFVVSVGSQVDVEGRYRQQQGASDIIGNVSLEYLLDESGIYRLKGFRKNEFTGMIDGQLVVSGLAFIFNKEINRINELWEKDSEEKE